MAKVVTKRLTIEEAEERHPDLIKGQKWGGNSAEYNFMCEKHGAYSQVYNTHDEGASCSKCGFDKLSKLYSLTTEIAEKRHPSLIKGQQWRGVGFKYKYFCEEHGLYFQTFSSHSRGGCQCCSRRRVAQKNCTAGGLSRTPEYTTIRNHFEVIFNSKNPQYKNYEGVPFFDGWNPKKGGLMLNGAQWIIDNLGKRPKGCILHIVEHDRGFVPGNLEWTGRKKQNAQQMFKIIANLKHRIRELEMELEQERKRI
jgi:hypothetical protein